MDIEQLRVYLHSLADSLNSVDREMLENRLKNLVSVFPFNEYEYMLMFLLDRGKISFGEYEKLRNTYVNANKYLKLYTLAPRIFGEIWAHQHIMNLDDRFKKPSKDLDPDYNGQYDLWIEGVRVEVKSARATNTKKRGDLVSKALRSDSKDPFWMNFQQIKLNMADVFILIGVWVDKIEYWVLTNEEVKNNRYLTHQHRKGIEYQIGMTERNISDFDVFKVTLDKIGDVVVRKGKGCRKR